MERLFAVDGDLWHANRSEDCLKVVMSCKTGRKIVGLPWEGIDKKWFEMYF